MPCQKAGGLARGPAGELAAGPAGGLAGGLAGELARGLAGRLLFFLFILLQCHVIRAQVLRGG